MDFYKIKFSLFLNYFVFAILLNSVGVVILQVQQNFGVGKTEASVLEAFKDLPIAVCSFVCASFLPRLGIKNAMMLALSLVTVICVVVPFVPSFLSFKLLFCVVGISFALMKISVFTTIGLLTSSDKQHASLMGYLEGCFMVGVLLGNLLFSFFIIDDNPASTQWLFVYWIIAGLSSLSLLFLLISKVDENKVKHSSKSIVDDIKASARLFKNKNVYLFLSAAFLFVLIEQSFQTWTPTFYNQNLKVPTSMSVQAGAILAGCFALGRFISGYFSRNFYWFSIVAICIIGFAISLFLVLPLSNQHADSSSTWWKAPLVVYLFPLMGIFLAPIYPLLNSVILSTLPNYLHSSMAGLIVVFSAIGGTFGSIVTGYLFEHLDGKIAFYFSLVPLTLLLVCAAVLSKNNKSGSHE